MTIPATGAAGTAIRWNSNNAAISSTGVVTRPAYGSGNATVTLTATITKGAASDTVVFSLTVPELPNTSQTIQVSKNFDVLYVRKTGKISAKGATGFISSNTGVASINSQGKILGKRPGTTIVTVTTPTGQESITVTVKYSFRQWLLVVFLFGWLWLPLQ